MLEFVFKRKCGKINFKKLKLLKEPKKRVIYLFSKQKQTWSNSREMTTCLVASIIWIGGHL